MSEKKYKVVNGTSYDETTPQKVIDVLEMSRRTGERIRVHYGDVATGVDWLEDMDITGRIGRSTGSIKIPLLVHNSRSFGGGGILDHCILKIKTSAGGKVLYQADNYQVPVLEIREGSDLKEYSHEVWANGSKLTRHHSFSAANKLKNKLQ